MSLRDLFISGLLVLFLIAPIAMRLMVAFGALNWEVAWNMIAIWFILAIVLVVVGEVVRRRD